MKAIETRNLTKVFEGRPAVNQVNLEIPSGTIYGIVGANGAGKSTLLRMLIGLLQPSCGEVRLFGEPLPTEAAEIRQRVHYVGADGEMYRSFKVHQMLRYASYLYERWDGKRCERLVEALKLPMKRYTRNLSTGMKLQLRLAIALSARPDLLILDEPTNGLDPIVKRQFLQLIMQEVAAGRTTVVMATHQLDDLERMADGVAVMYEGKVTASGMLDELKASIKCIQAVLPNGLPANLQNHPDIIEVAQSGQLFTLTVKKHSEQIREQLQKNGSNYVEIVDLGLEDLFRHLLHKEGYTRDALLLS